MQEEQTHYRRLSRREFLVSGAGAGLFLFCVGGRSLSAQEADVAPPGLDIFEQGYPRAFFFRQTEGDARSGKLSFESWEKRYLPLNGIMGKVLNEAHDYTGKNNVPFFLQYKANNPSKAVFLHYNGTGRRATDGATTDFFAGHWLYYKGTELTRQVGGRSSANVLRVADTSVFKLNRTGGVNDDIAIAPVDDNGRPEWGRAEQVRLQAIDASRGTITVERGAYGTQALSFPAGSYVAAHVMTGPYRHEDSPEQNVPLWSYNFSTVCPRDAQGRNCGDALVDYLVGKLGPGGELSAFDGIVFDVFSFIARFGNPVKDIDADTNGEADGGVVNGVNVVGLGATAFIRALRARLPGKIIMADGHIPTASQRSFGDLNGIESEGYPDKTDINLDGLSRGENVFNFWRDNCTAPSLNYVNFRYISKRPRKYRNTFREPNLSEDQSYKKLRLALASAQFADAAFTYQGEWAPPDTVWKQHDVRVRVFDELWQGVEQKPNWLGMPLGPAVFLAGESPDLLNRRGEVWPQKFVGRFEGDGVEFVRETDPGPRMAVKPTFFDAQTPVLERVMTFKLPGVEVPDKDLFVSLRLKGDPLKEYPESIGRNVRVIAVRSVQSGKKVRKRKVESHAWANAVPFTATFYFRNFGPGKVDLRFKVEGDQTVYFERLTAHSAADAGYREFENGVVFANHSRHPYTFELSRLFPGASFRRIQGSENQDPKTNNGRPLGEVLTLRPRDGLFVVRNSPYI